MTRLVLYCGALAQVPRQGGLTWLHLQFLLGLRRLGWKVLFLDRLSPALCVDESGRPAAVDESLNLRYFRRVLREYGLGGSFSLSSDGGRRVFGLPRAEVLRRAARAE